VPTVNAARVFAVGQIYRKLQEAQHGALPIPKKKKQSANNPSTTESPILIELAQIRGKITLLFDGDILNDAPNFRRISKRFR
jgi:hypothetical protein